MENNNRPTIIDFVEKYTHQFADHTYLREKVDGQWKEITQEETRRTAYRIGAGLMALGLEKGDKIALLSESRSMWILAELGALYAGATDVPLSVNLGADADLIFRIGHSDATWILVSGNQLPKIRKLLPQTVKFKSDASVGSQSVKGHCVPRFLCAVTACRASAAVSRKACRTNSSAVCGETA
jgi:long-chain acyl-CoA synthetase